MPLSSAGETLMLNTFLTGRFISLHNDDPGDLGGSEVVGGAYARQGPIAFAQSGNNPTVAKNTGVVEYPTATAGWGYITYFGVWSSQSGGTYLGGDTVQTPKDVGIGDTARWDIGSLIIAAD